MAACAGWLGAALPHRVAAAVPVSTPDIRADDFRLEDFYNPRRIWTARFTLTPEQFDAMQPKLGLPPARGGQAPAADAAAEMRNGLAAQRGIIFDDAHADLAIEGRGFKDVAVRYKGNGTYFASAGRLKMSLKVDLNKYDPAQNFLGRTTLNFHSCVRDPGFMNEVLAYQFYREAGVPAPRVTYARVYLTVPGRHQDRYIGLFTVVENIDPEFLRDRLPPGNGALFKPASGLLFADQGTDWSAYNQRYDPKTTLTEAQKKRMLEIIAFMNQATPEEFTAKLGDYVDLENFGSYLAGAAWMVNMDSPLHTGQNHYLYLRPDNQKLMFLPWDQDESWGQVVGTQEQRNDLSILQPWLRQIPVLQRIFSAEPFRKVYLLKLAQLTLGPGDPKAIATQVDELAALLRPSLLDESAQTADLFDQSVAGQPVRHMVGIGLNEFLPIKSFVAARQPSVLIQLTTK
jgi:spore coat protein H